MQWFTNPKKSDLGWLRYHSPYLAHHFLVMSPSVRLAPFWRGRFQHCLTQFPPHTRRHIHLSHSEKKDVKGCQRIHWKWNCSFSAPLKLETSELAGNTWFKWPSMLVPQRMPWFYRVAHLDPSYIIPPSSTRKKTTKETMPTWQPNLSGWWLTYPSEKWWSSSVGVTIPNIYIYIWKVIKAVFQTTNQSLITINQHHSPLLTIINHPIGPIAY